jgi:hypothetical protein
MKCSNCGGEQWTITDRIGAIETWRCLTCSKEEVVHVNAPISISDLPSNLEDVFRLVAEWVAIPCASDVESLRSLFPRVKDLTLATMTRAARERKTIELGRFTDSELRQMSSTLGSLRLKLSRIPIGQ